MRFEDFSMNADQIYDSCREHTLKSMPMQTVDTKPYAESIPERMNLGVLQSNLGNCLQIIDDEIMKGYVTQLERLPIIHLETGIMENLQEIHFFKISELVYQENEFSVDKLAMVFHALSNRPCTLVLMLKSDGNRTDFYLGARPDENYSAGTLFQMLKQSLLGFLPGSKITEYYDEDMKRDMQDLKVGCISSVTCVADYKRNQDSLTNQDFIQGLEKFVYAVQGKEYIAVLIADNLGHDALMLRKREYEQIYTQISPFANMQMNFTASDGVSLSVGSSEGNTKNVACTQSKGLSESETDSESHTVGTNETTGVSNTDTGTHTVTKSETDGVNHTVGTADGISRTITNGSNIGTYSGVSGNGGLKIGPFNLGMSKNIGINMGFNHSVAKGINHTDSVSDSVSKTLTHGLSDSYGHSHSDSKTYGKSESDNVTRSIGIGRNESESYTVGGSFNLMNTETMMNTFGGSKGVTLNAQNMTLKFELQRIEKHLKRIEECESFGMWNFAAYFLGETAAEVETAANTYKSVMAGTDSGIERSAINSWIEEESVKELFNYIQNFLHPQFIYHGFSYDEERCIEVNPSVLVSTNELAIHMGLPRHSVCGLPVIEHADFGKEVVQYDQKEDGRTFTLGQIFSMGSKTNTKVRLDCDSLTMHTFVTGSTGSGKSNTVYKTLEQLRNLYKIPFLVIEPAKGEYKHIFGQFPDVAVYGTNPKVTELLKINPFRFPEDIHVLEHLDRLVEIFNVCWPMYAAMPEVLKSAVEKSYVDCGWDLLQSTNKDGEDLYPSFADVARNIKSIIESSEFDTENKGAYKGSLLTRLQSLSTGINGLIFSKNEISDNDLFDRNVIVDLSRVGSSETKSLIMGMLVLKLQEYRMDKGKMNRFLSHVTVLEEAHNLLKRTSTEQSAEGANLLGKSVELLANSIAEMRTYGEGFIIADQSPGLLDLSVIRNTNTKIILRLPDRTDRELVGYAAGLNDEHIEELAKLKQGVAAIYQNDWIEPVLVQIDKCEIEEKEYHFTAHTKPIDLNVCRQQLINFMIRGRVDSPLEFDVSEIEKGLGALGLSMGNQEFVEELIAEYKETGSLELWRDDNFRRLSKRITDILESRNRIENSVLSAHDNQELTEELKKIVLQMFPNADKEVVLTLSQCFMKDMSLQKEEHEIRRGIYKNWIDSVREAW